MDASKKNAASPLFNPLAAILVAVLALGCYLNTLSNEFVLDELPWVQRAGNIEQFTQLKRWFVEPSMRDARGVASYRPLALVNLAIDRHVWQLRPIGFHQASIGLHALNAVLVYWLALRVTRRGGVAAAVAALFAVQPLATGCVSYVANRGPLLAATLSLLSALSFVQAEERPDAAAWLLSGASAVFGAAAFFAGENALVLPVLLALYVAAFGKRFRVRTCMCLAALAAAALVYLGARYAALAGRWGASPQTLTAWRGAAELVRVLGEMVMTVFVPVRVDLERSVAMGGAAEAACLFLLGGMAALGAVFVLARSRGRLSDAWWGTAWFCGGALPWAVVATRYGLIAAHWLYLPSIGAWLAACRLGVHYLERTSRVSMSLQTVRIGTAAVVGLLLARTLARNADWRSETKLLAQTLAAAPGTTELRLRYARALQRDGGAEEAIRQLQIAADNRPQDAGIQSELAIALGTSGQTERAIEHFEAALRLDPNNPRRHYELAVAYAMQKRVAEAIEHYRLSLAGPDKSPDACNNLAWLLATTTHDELRNGAEAVQLAQFSVRESGRDDPVYLDTLAAAYAEAGNFDQAARVAQKAAELAQRLANTDQAAAIRARARLYLAHKPYRE